MGPILTFDISTVKILELALVVCFIYAQIANIARSGGESRNFTMGVNIIITVSYFSEVIFTNIYVFMCKF